MPDGAIEVAARRKDYLERLRVDDDGRISELATVTLPSRGRQRREFLESHLGRRQEWHAPTNLHGWAPRTSAQLAAVEEIANDHDGLALVRDVGAATIEVRAPRKGALDWYVIHGDGTVEQSVNPSRRRQRWVRRLMVPASLVLFFGLSAAGYALGTIAHWIGWTLGIAAVILLWRQTPEERLSRGDPGWIEIRTYVDESD